jgi:hypothetical protein
LCLRKVDGAHRGILYMPQDNIGARLSIYGRQYGGGVENDSTQERLPGGALQLIRRQD